MANEKGKSPTQKNRELLGGKNTLATKDGVNEKSIKKLREDKEKELKKPFTERENIKNRKSIFQNPREKFDRETWEKNQEITQKEVDKNLEKSSTQKSIDSNNKDLPKSGIVKNIGKGLGKVLPYVGAAITAKEIYDYGKELYDEIKNEKPLSEQLQKLHEENPDRIPEPPSLDKTDELTTDKENVVMLDMRSFEKEEPDFLKNLESQTEKESVEIDMEISNDNTDISDEYTEGMMLGMGQFEIDEPEFLNHLKPRPTVPDDFDDMTDPVMDGDDGSDSSDGGDGGGDGGGD